MAKGGASDDKALRAASYQNTFYRRIEGRPQNEAFTCEADMGNA